MKKLTMLILLAAFAVQTAAVAHIILQYRRTATHGHSWLFATEPVDPRDYFRGQYVALNFAANRDYPSALCASTDYYGTLKRIYVEFEKDAQGYAEIGRILAEPPAHDNYLAIDTAYCYSDEIHIRLPFDRYYANEKTAPQLEIKARDNRELLPVLEVKILNGRYSVEALHFHTALGAEAVSEEKSSEGDSEETPRRGVDKK